MATNDIRKMINHMLDPKGRGKKLANAMSLPMLRAIRDGDDPAVAWGPAIAVIACLCSEPDEDKEQAISFAKQFGEHLLNEVQEQWESLIAIRRRFDAEEFKP